jgi:hypothetical protein
MQRFAIELKSYYKREFFTQVTKRFLKRFLDLVNVPVKKMLHHMAQKLQNFLYCPTLVFPLFSI